MLNQEEVHEDLLTEFSRTTLGLIMTADSLFTQISTRKRNDVGDYILSLH